MKTKSILIKGFFLFLVSMYSFNLKAQVGIGTITPHTSSVLDISSTTQGFLPPRIADLSTITNPSEGLLVYSEAFNCLATYNGTEWINLCNSGGNGGGGGEGTPPSALQARIVAGDAAAADFFGYDVTVSADGNTLASGAYGEGSLKGAVYVFTRNGSSWTQQQKITSSDAENLDFFGSSVALSSDGNTLVVGTPGEGTFGSGAVYVFTRSGGVWTEQQKVQALQSNNTPIAQGVFGSSIAISDDGNTFASGAYSVDGQGAVYVFTRSGGVWTQQQKVESSDIEVGDRFGHNLSLSADGNVLAVGAYQENTGGTKAGSAYVFTRSGGVWTQQQKLQSNDIAAGDFFGQDVALSGDGTTLAIGATRVHINGIDDAGATYIFTNSGGVWTQEQKLDNNADTDNEYFGFSLSLSVNGNTLAIGTQNHDGVSTTNSGAVYIFTRSGGVWTEANKLVSSNGATGFLFGFSTALNQDGSTLAVGSYTENTPDGVNAGAVYIFD